MFLFYFRNISFLDMVLVKILFWPLLFCFEYCGLKYNFSLFYFVKYVILIFYFKIEIFGLSLL